MSGIKIIAKNKRAFFEYEILDTWEAGLQLQGTEVKSLRAGKVNLSDGWVDFQEDEAFLRDIHISPYSHGNLMNHEERRSRRLLLHRREIIRLMQQTEEKGMTVVPLKIYFKSSWIKVELGLGRGKKLHDKRDTTKKREADREIARAMKR